ncbi:hypothetical protein HDU88_001192 [Geranomyces variabilis]|nr:hypothetical protein HDU88_001192 [Geranomyces variabilis]
MSTYPVLVFPAKDLIAAVRTHSVAGNVLASIFVHSKESPDVDADLLFAADWVRDARKALTMAADSLITRTREATTTRDATLSLKKRTECEHQLAKFHEAYAGMVVRYQTADAAGERAVNFATKKRKRINEEATGEQDAEAGGEPGSSDEEAVMLPGDQYFEDPGLFGALVASALATTSEGRRRTEKRNGHVAKLERAQELLQEIADIIDEVEENIEEALEEEVEDEVADVVSKVARMTRSELVEFARAQITADKRAERKRELETFKQRVSDKCRRLQLLQRRRNI